MTSKDSGNVAFEKDLVTGVLRENCQKIGLSRITDVSANPAVGKNENYGSDILRLTVLGETESGQKAQRSVILKQKRREENDIDVTEELGIFKSESLVYNSVLQPMEEIIMQLNEEKVWPTMIAVVKNKFFLEDLKELGYQLTPIENGHSVQQARLVIKSLAKFHALSRVIVERGIFDPNQLEPYIYTRGFPYIDNIHTTGMKNLIQEVEEWGTEWSTVAKKLKEAAQDLCKKYKNLWEKTRGKFDVINHGDCWSNNMMFKCAPGESSSHSMRLVDFQICHYNSPGWDLSYYIFNSIPVEMRNSELESLLSLYAEELRANCDKFGCRGPVLDAEGVRQSFREVTFFGTMINLVYVPMSLASTQEDFNFKVDDFLDEIREPYNYFKQENVTTALKDILKDLVKNKLL